MQTSDYISGIALSISAVAIYFCWANNRQNQKLLSAQKKTELVQKIDEAMFKVMNLETIFEEMLYECKGDKGIQDFVIKNFNNDTSKTFHNTIKQLEEYVRKNKKCVEDISDIRESAREIDININPVLFEKRLQSVNKLFLHSEHLASTTEKVKERIQQHIKKLHLEVKEKMLNNKKSD